MDGRLLPFSFVISFVGFSSFLASTPYSFYTWHGVGGVEGGGLALFSFSFSLTMFCFLCLEMSLHMTVMLGMRGTVHQLYIDGMCRLHIEDSFPCPTASITRQCLKRYWILNDHLAYITYKA